MAKRQKVSRLESAQPTLDLLLSQLTQRQHMASAFRLIPLKIRGKLNTLHPFDRAALKVRFRRLAFLMPNQATFLAQLQTHVQECNLMRDKRKVRARELKVIRREEKDAEEQQLIKAATELAQVQATPTPRLLYLWDKVMMTTAACDFAVPQLEVTVFQVNPLDWNAPFVFLQDYSIVPTGVNQWHLRNRHRFSDRRLIRCSDLLSMCAPRFPYNTAWLAACVKLYKSVRDKLQLLLPVDVFDCYIWPAVFSRENRMLLNAYAGELLFHLE
jgi:hypothetical protein